ncbi:MAG: permease [Caldisericia bacterium]|nr:permease [Caldisericia bacterium]
MGITILYILIILLFTISFKKDRKKTKEALKKSWKSLDHILPEFLFVVVIVGIAIAFLDPDTISTLIGKQSGWIGVTLCNLVGSITLIPGMIAFPTAAMMINNGAGYMQIGAFISSLMMVGVVTMPMEIKYFGKKLTVIRNVFAFIFTFFVAYIISIVMVGI